MTTGQYKRMLKLKHDVHSTYGLTPKYPENLQELYEEYIKLRRMYSECKGEIKDE